MQPPCHHRRWPVNTITTFLTVMTYNIMATTTTTSTNSTVSLSSPPLPPPPSSPPWRPPPQLSQHCHHHHHLSPPQSPPNYHFHYHCSHNYHFHHHHHLYPTTIETSYYHHHRYQQHHPNHHVHHHCYQFQYLLQKHYNQTRLYYFLKFRQCYQTRIKLPGSVGSVGQYLGLREPYLAYIWPTISLEREVVRSAEEPSVLLECLAIYGPWALQLWAYVIFLSWFAQPIRAQITVCLPCQRVTCYYDFIFT